MLRERSLQDSTVSAEKSELHPATRAGISETDPKWPAGAESPMQQNQAAKPDATGPDGPRPQPVEFDPSELLDRLDGDRSLLQMILDEFVRDIPEELETLKRATGGKDAAVVTLKGHSIKGACLNVGARALGQLACDIESAGKQGRFNDAHALTLEFERGFSTLRKILSGTSKPDSQQGQPVRFNG